MLNKMRMLFLASILVLAGLGSLSTPVFACTNPGLYFDGMTTNFNGIVTSGAQAYVTRYNPHICTVSAAWSMIANTNNGNELAQVGWAKLSSWSTSTVYYFYEYGQSSFLNPPVLLSAVPNPSGGASDKFTVFTNGNNVTEFLINNSLKFSTTLNWTPNNAEWFGETHSYPDQTPGDTVDFVEFSNVQHLYNGQWYNDNAAIDKYNNSPYGTGSWPNSNYFYIWDTRY